MVYEIIIIIFQLKIRTSVAEPHDWWKTQKTKKLTKVWQPQPLEEQTATKIICIYNEEKQWPIN